MAPTCRSTTAVLLFQRSLSSGQGVSSQSSLKRSASDGSLQHGEKSSHQAAEQSDRLQLVTPPKEGQYFKHVVSCRAGSVSAVGQSQQAGHNGL